MRRKLTTLLAGLSGLIIVDAPVTTALATAARVAGVVVVAATSPTPPPLAATQALTNDFTIRLCDVDKLTEEFAECVETDAFLRPTDMVSPYAARIASPRQAKAAWWCLGSGLAGA